MEEGDRTEAEKFLPSLEKQAMEERRKTSVKVLKKKGHSLRSVSLNCIFFGETFLAQRCFLSLYGTHLKVERGKTCMNNLQIIQI